ncbi:MAG: translocation/assembly module TamB domain-containing protein [Parvularculaceae bacterium]|nr:translocation/assembly module TamB domain-containing protein [Parvularculaceae bacterium]
MRRFVVISAGIIVVAVALIGVTTALLFSPVGRSAISSIAERKIASAIGGNVEIGSLNGDLLRTLEFNSVRLSANGADWATIDHVAIKWSAAAVLAREVVIKEILVKDARLLARPPTRQSGRPFKGFELPDHLPTIALDRIIINNLQVDRMLVGEPLRIDGDGAIRLGEKALYVVAQLKGSEARDEVIVKIERPAEGGSLSLKIDVRSKSSGVIATLLRSGGPISISVNGSGPIDRYNIDLRGAAGELGSFEAQISGNFEASTAFEYSFAGRPGTRFASLQSDIGDQIQMEGIFEPTDHGGTLRISALELGLGTVTGALEWKNRSSALERARVKLFSTLAPGWRETLQRAIGETVEADLTLISKGEKFLVGGVAKSPFVTLKSDGLKTDLRSAGGGPVEVWIGADSSLASAAKSSVSLTAVINVIGLDTFEFSAIDASTATGARFAGVGTYSRSEESLFLKGEYRIAEEVVHDLAPSLTPTGAITGELELNGPIDDLSLQTTASLPAFDIGRGATRPVRAKVALASIPAALSGDISLRSTDGTMQGSATIARAPDGFWTISKLDYRGSGFVLSGGASFNLATREGAADLRYAGDDAAEPWPGLRLTGVAAISGAMLKANVQNSIEITAPRLASTQWTAENLHMKIEGPFRRANFSVEASGFRATERLEIDNLRLNGIADFGAGPTFSIDGASAAYGGAPVSLARSATISLGDSLSVTSLALRFGSEGHLNLDGDFTSQRWRATAKIDDFDIANTNSTLDFTLALDTNANTPASGAFAVSSALSNKENSSLAGKFAWNGDRVLINAGDEGGALAVNAALPLRLIRSNKMAITMDGTISGEARYAGRAEAFAIFLPAALQAFEGDLSFTGELGGTLANPEITGGLDLSRGAYTELVSGLSFIDIDLSASAKASASGSKLSFTATAAGAGQTRKSVEAKGTIVISDKIKIDSGLTFDRARFSAGPVQSVDASGALAITGTPDNLLIEGDFKIYSLIAEMFNPQTSGLVDIEVVAVGANGNTNKTINASARRGALRYAIRIEADDSILVRGRGLDSEWRANAQITGTSGNPLILGTLNLRRGDLEFSGRRFDIVRGAVGFDMLSPNDPTIDLRAERDTREGTTVAVVISGRSSALQVALESTPSLPSEDAMALVLFDKPANELSTLQSLQVADALTQLGGVGVFGGKGVAGAARDALGLDFLNIEIDQEDSSASLLTVGKYVADGLFVSASQNARGESGSLRIEYEIGQSFSVQTELRQDGDQQVSANWKKDF